MVEPEEEIDVGNDLVITKINPRTGVGGAWVSGRLNGHCFEALVFPEKAQRSEWELHGSRVSNLWLRRLADKEVVFAWDRALVTPAQTEMAQQIVDFLTAGLADHVYSR